MRTHGDHVISTKNKGKELIRLILPSLNSHGLMLDNRLDKETIPIETEARFNKLPVIQSSNNYNLFGSRHWYRF